MEDHPNIRVLPPVVLLVAIVASAVASLLAPAPVTRRGWLRLAGIPLLVGGFGLTFSAARRMRKAGTSPNPHEPSTALVTEGPYRFTRNPIYLGFAVCYAGLGLLANTLWFLPFAAAMMAIIQTQVIRYEEGYLEEKFGTQYSEYKNSVRRWI